ncbi:MAG: cobalamin-binding protein [Desulfohalobiaceae bacterium]|nr:cobalamin-binding protein [Desulfohalobiaceae bacterium]
MIRKKAVGRTLLLACCVLLLASASNIHAAKKLTDQTGRQIRVPDSPQRVVSLAPSLTECVFALQREDRLAGVSANSDHPPAATELPNLGTYVAPDLERIISLEPDLCLATRDGNPVSLVRRLEELGIPVFALDPRDLDQVFDSLRLLGRVLEAERKAEELVRDLKQRIERVQKRVAKTEHRPRVFYQIGASPIVSAGSDTFIHELIRMAGGSNLAAGPKQYPRYSREEVLVLDPEVIIVSSMTGNRELTHKVRRMWSEFPGIEAVRSGRIHAVDADCLNRASPRLVRGLEILAHLLHPGLFQQTPLPECP